jgi:NADH-quinone oxidoreductase subunit G
MIIPPVTNTLGVSMICELDEAQEGLSVGYNVKADYTLSAKGDGDLDMPSLNQQEGTFINIDKKLVPLNVAAEYKGYVLNDLANALGLESEHTINYTSKLGFEDICFDDLDNYYDNVGNEYRGYEIKAKSNRKRPKLDEVAELGEFNGSVLYNKNPIDQFSVFTKDCKQIIEKDEILGSEQFATAAKIKSGDKVKFVIDGDEYVKNFHLDRHMKGTIAYNPTFSIDSRSSNYRYNQVKLEVINE